MERNYKRSWLVGLAVLCCGAAVARAQEPPPVKMAAEGPTLDQTLQPIGPVDAGTVADAQFFKPPDLTQIGTCPELNYGPFFQYERLYWSEHQPSTSTIGDVATAIAAGSTNDLDTGFMKAGFVWGNRFDIGYVQEDESGWLTSIIKTNTQFNTFTADTPTTIFFANANTVLIPNFPNGVVISNTTRLDGIELLKTYRYPVGHDGSIWTAMFGVRYFQLHDRFDIEAQPLGADNGSMDLGINNNIVGPEVGLQWKHENERWNISADFRAMFGANFQNATDSGFFPPRFDPAGITAHTFQGALDNIEFAPLGELRLDAAYKVTSNVAIKVGYTALLVSGIGRAANRMEYSWPDLGITSGGDKEHFFANGVSFGVEINR